MEHLLQSQIRESCRLALPEGLKDLMADISREVLRAQPEDLYRFIADYLATLLVAREHLFIAARVCDNVCKNRCCPELEDELRQMSLSEEDVQETLKIVVKYFSSGEVKEGNLLQKLMQKTNIGQKELPVVQEAVRRAFLRHRVNSTAYIESVSMDSQLDETTLAAQHTLKIYKKVTEDPDINYDCVATKIQAAYRAYNVRRIRNEVRSGKRRSTNEKVHFHVKDDKDKPKQKETLIADLVRSKRCASKCSSMSLAGSFLSLPLYDPYSIEHRSDITEVDEVSDKERERANFDYDSSLHRNFESLDHETENKKDYKKVISFDNLLKVVEVDYNEILDEAEEAGYESEEVEEDLLDEHLTNGEGNIDKRINGGDTDKEQLGNTDEFITTETLVLNEPTNYEDKSSESVIDEDDDNGQVLQSEMHRIFEEFVAQDDAQENDFTFDDDTIKDDKDDGHGKGTTFEVEEDKNITYL